jgi:hypothetical protein
MRMSCLLLIIGLQKCRGRFDIVHRLRDNKVYGTRCEHTTPAHSTTRNDAQIYDVSLKSKG